MQCGVRNRSQLGKRCKRAKRLRRSLTAAIAELRPQREKPAWKLDAGAEHGELCLRLTEELTSPIDGHLYPEPGSVTYLPRRRRPSMIGSAQRGVVPLRRILAVAGVASIGAFAATPAIASENVGPSSAVTVQPGVPFSGTWKGTPKLHGGFRSHWWRLAPLLRTGDTVQVAVDNTAPEFSSFFCLIPPVDEFGADSAQEACEDIATVVSRGRLSRLSLTYNGATGQPFFVALADSDAAQDDDGGPYTATIESITTRVNIGSVPPARVERTFSYGATLRYGDNTPVADGSRAVLEWRRAKGTPGPESFTTLASAGSVGGQVVFNAALPSEARDKIELRACAAQPGGGPRCTPTAKVAVVAPVPVVSAKCLKAKRARSTLRKRVLTLKKRIATTRRSSKRRRYARKLRVANKRLKSARRAAAKQCS